MTWVDAVGRNGGRVWVTRQQVAVQDERGGSHGPIPLVRWHRNVRPSDLVRLPPDVMVVADHLTKTAALRLTGQHWWATTADGRYRVAGMANDGKLPADPVAHRRAAPLDAQLAALVLAAPERPHRFYAHALGVSRVRVTQLFQALRASCGSLDAHNLLAYWVAADPRTTGHVTRWKSLGPAWQQTQSAYAWLEDQHCTPVVGGEVAADAHRPWRAPGSVLLHVRKLTPPPAGFVIADSPQTASVTVVVDPLPAVDAIAKEMQTPIGRVRIAHPLHVAQDLAGAPSHDERTAAHRRMLLEPGLVSAS